MTAKWTEWEVIYSDYWTSYFNKLVRKRLPYSAEIAEETMEDVRQELAIKLSKLDTAPNSINAYLHTAFRNTLEDYLRSKEGYPRPPEWIKRLGAAYERIYKLLCLENRAVNDIHSMLENMYQYTRDFVEQVVTEVRAGVVNCGSWRDSVSIENVISEVEAAGQHNRQTLSPEEILQDMDSRSVIETILGQQLTSTDFTDVFAEALAALSRCEMGDDERLLLRLVYTEGCSVSKAARLVGLPDAEARKRLKKTMQHLEKTLSDAGISIL